MSNCNEQRCTCPTRECPNHGKCCACINTHRESSTLVNCMRRIAEKK